MWVQMSGCVSHVEQVIDVGGCRDMGMHGDGEVWMCLAQGVTVSMREVLSSLESLMRASIFEMRLALKGSSSDSKTSLGVMLPVEPGSEDPLVISEGKVWLEESPCAPVLYTPPPNPSGLRSDTRTS